MHCTTCDTVNEDGARFCRVCGASLVATSPQYVISNAPMTGPACPTCRQRNPEGARYCVFCATQLAPSMSIAQATQQPAGVVGTPAPGYTGAQPLQIRVAHSPNLIIRAIWFFLIGWWLGLLWTLLAWAFNLTIIGLPVGAMMINAIPQIMTLRARTRAFQAVQVGTGGAVVMLQRPELPLPLRALWFLLIGSWASLLWMLAAWWCCATIILMPIAFWMFDRVPTVATLAPEYP